MPAAAYFAPGVNTWVAQRGGAPDIGSRAPWIIIGHSDDLEKAWNKNCPAAAASRGSAPPTA